MKKLLLIFSLFALFSCGKSNLLDKSIIEDFTIKEVSIASKDSLFTSAYEAVSKFKLLNKDNKLVLAKYLELTWQDYIDFTEQIPVKDIFIIENSAHFEERYLKYSTPILLKGQKLMDSLVNEFKAGKMKKATWNTKYHIKEYIKDQLKSNEKGYQPITNYHIERITEEFIDPNFLSSWDYEDVVFDSILNLKNPLANDLHKNLKNIYKELEKDK